MAEDTKHVCGRDNIRSRATCDHHGVHDEQRLWSTLEQYPLSLICHTRTQEKITQAGLAHIFAPFFGHSFRFILRLPVGGLGVRDHKCQAKIHESK